jgi:hypothetical protein
MEGAAAPLRLRRSGRSLPHLQRRRAAADAIRLQGRRRQERMVALNSNGWSRHFDDPIVLPSGRKLITLRDRANYIT